MGACASVPKGMRDQNAAPVPEPQKEETVDDKEATVDGEENKGEISEVDKKVVEEGDKAQSLRTLLNENETPKESINNEKTTQTEAVPSKPVNVENPKPDDLPVAVATTPFEEVSKDEEKKTEVRGQGTKMINGVN